MGAVLQQRVQNAWQPLAFFSRKLSPSQQKYSAYDRELLAIYQAVKHFRHMLEVRHFIIFTGHKPITFASQLNETGHRTATTEPQPRPAPQAAALPDTPPPPATRSTRSGRHGHFPARYDTSATISAGG
jgi:hypothetical protein